jgi:hypothetical protein
MPRTRLTLVIILEMCAAVLAGIVAGGLVGLGRIDGEIEFGIVFLATLHLLAVLATAAVLLASVGLGFFTAVTGRLPRSLGGEPVSRRYALVAISGVVCLALALFVLLA